MKSLLHAPDARRSPFHRGEQEIQSRLGVREEIEPWARRVVRSHLPDEHRSFYESLPYVVAAARDERGRPWATLLTGEPGFLSSPDPERLRIDARPAAGDALAQAFVGGGDLGLLGIELHTRRRNRVNGRLMEDGGDAVALRVEQSFGNCPQFIHPRPWRRVDHSPRAEPAVRHVGTLPTRLRGMIEQADTFFIATGLRGSGEHPAFGMDASHRGGPPGFVAFESDRTLVFPDYAGNNHFNTLGNLVLDPRAGLLFVDFEAGHLLQLTGRASVDWSDPDQRRFPGARRLVRFEIEEAVDQPGTLPLRFESPHQGLRDLRLAERTRESRDVVSFELEATDGRPLPDWRPGQHLPLTFESEGDAAAVERAYSISNPPGSTRYRISVKREPRGWVSRHIHDTLRVGDHIPAGAPGGDFTLDPEQAPRPIVLVAGGIGITPLVPMLHAIVASDASPRVHFVLGARDREHAALEAEVRRLVARSRRAHLHVRYSREEPAPLETSADARWLDVARGRVDIELLEGLAPDLDADFYLCGPSGFIADLTCALQARGVPESQIHMESFGGRG